MKISYKKGMFFLLFITFSVLVSAQRTIPDALKRKLEGKTKLTEIMKEVDEYYTSGEGRNETGSGEAESKPYVHWKRWEWWVSSHLDAQGNFIKNINKLNYDALTASEQQWASEINKTIQNAAQNNTNRTAQSREQANALARDGEIVPELAYGDWSLVGPTAEGATVTGDIKGLGRLDRIAFHPTNANIIYVGAPSGNLWKTTNGGSSWVSVTDGLPAPGIAGVAVSPTNGNVIYILTGDGDSYNPGYFVYDFGSSRPSIGVFKSTDGGTTWAKMGALYTGAGDYEGHRLAISPTNGNYLFATTSQGVYRTTDGGVSWTQVKTGEHWDVEFKPNNDSVVYCTSGSAIFYSNNGGRSGTWNTATTDFSVASARRIELAVSANNANYVYALCGAVPASSTFTGIFRSTNSGVSYTRRTNSPNILNSSITGTGTGEQSDYDLGICVKPNNAEIIATAGLNVWRSSGANG
ncbi:MAG: hypothetical protein JNM68_08540, partial [Dinghuibacter sp.]|nr:hypothetical protein [Dinghuibacter sp.]